METVYYTEKAFILTARDAALRKAGIHGNARNAGRRMDSCFRRNDERRVVSRSAGESLPWT
jgi:hypothetical protein